MRILFCADFVVLEAVSKALCDVFFSIHALRGAKGEDTQVFAPVGISVTADNGRILGNFIYTPL